MSVLTRIKNNQITDATIWANAKIIPGSIVGSLFNSNITVTSDFTITGNLTVQGAATYLTVASTNTYVNDPLIVLNNAFSGSNSYDLGFIFNRGSDPNKAFYWDESSDEFRLITTTETGTTYGSIAAETNFEKLRLGNLVAQYDVSTITLTATGFINTTANVSAAIVNTGALNATGTTTLVAVNSTGFINTTGNVSAAVVNAGQFNTTGNLSATQVSTQTLKASELTSGRVVFTGTSGLLVSNAGITFSANTLTVGGALPITINGTTATIATTSTNQDLILSPNGSGAIDADTSIIKNVSDPVSAQDAATKNYIDSTLSAYDPPQIIVGDTEVTITDTGSDGTITAKADGATVAVITSSLTDFKILTKVSNTTASTSTTTGAFQVVGGIGIGGQLTGAVLKSTDTTQSTSTTTGAIITAGGLGVAKNLNVGGDATITGNLTVQGVLTAIQSTTLDVSDLQITLAKGAGTSAAADGAGINVDYGNVGANITYTHATTSWNFNKPIIGSSYANFGGNVLAAGGILNTLTVNSTTTAAAINSSGFINTTANISGAVVNTGALNATGTTTLVAVNSTGFINTTGNISGAVINGGAINSTGLINTTANISGAVVNTGALNATGTTTLVAVNSTGFINTTANVSAAVVNTGALNATGTTTLVAVNSTGFINTTANISGAVINTATLNATGVASITNSTDTTSLSTGALIVTGGTAVGKTLWVGEGAVINSTRAAEAFQVYGATGNNGLIYTNTAKNAIVFSATGNVNVQDGVITKFDSDGAIILPVGSSSRRPGSTGNVDVAGMLRYSTTSNNVEFYDGSNWQAAGSEFTVITTNAFNGNGVQTAFTLSSASTTAGTIVMVNGVVQIPVTAYSVSSTTLTFTEAPATGDVIDARVLITTATVSSVSSGNGYNSFDVATTPYANITAGTSSPTVRVSVDGTTGTATFTNDVIINGNLTVKGGSSGNINIGDQDTDKVQLIGEVVFDQAVPVQVTDTNLTQLDSFPVAAYSSAIYEVQVKQVGGSQANVSLYKAHVVQNTVNSFITTYGIVNTGNAMGTLSSNVVSGTTRLWYTPVAGQAIANVKVKTTYIV